MEKLAVNIIKDLINNVRKIGYSEQEIVDITGLSIQEIESGIVHGTA